jgi:hypothetical protein
LNEAEVIEVPNFGSLSIRSELSLDGLLSPPRFGRLSRFALDSLWIRPRFAPDSLSYALACLSNRPRLLSRVSRFALAYSLAQTCLPLRIIHACANYW